MRAIFPAASIQAQFSPPLSSCLHPLEAIMMSDLCKLAFAAVAISGLAIGLLAATTAAALAGL
jgi:hypothetical protein